MLNVACVLRTDGGEYRGVKNAGETEYGPGHVARLKNAVDEHLSVDHRFYCLSDVDVPCRRIDLVEDWPGWWAKIELFGPGLFTGRVLYLDLDTSIVGSLDELARFEGRFGMPEDWHHSWLGASGVMMWEAGPWVTDRIYCPFVDAPPEGAMSSFRGDQNWISGAVDWTPLREEYPGQIVSRWEECADGVPEDARIVCWHGTPRPEEIDWELTGSREHWREQVA